MYLSSSVGANPTEKLQYMHFQISMKYLSSGKEEGFDMTKS